MWSKMRISKKENKRRKENKSPNKEREHPRGVSRRSRHGRQVGTQEKDLLTAVSNRIFRMGFST